MLCVVFYEAKQRGKPRSVWGFLGLDQRSQLVRKVVLGFTPLAKEMTCTETSPTQLRGYLSLTQTRMAL